MEAKVQTNKESKKVKVNPLRQESVYVRFVPHENNYAGTDKRHAAYGNKMDGSFDIFCVPILRSTGTFKNVLTNDEKDFLEEYMQLDYNTLSVHKKPIETNYWANFKVRLTKEGIRLNLNDPEDFIKYKVLLANSDSIAPSVQERIERPKATYMYEIVRDSEEASMENAKMDATMASYKEFDKIKNDMDTMRILVELMDGRPYAQNTKADFLRSRINLLIQANPKIFLSNITDPMLHTKVVIRRAMELGKVSKKGDFYYLASDNTPLCEQGENPTLPFAAAYLNAPAHQDIKFLLESEVEKSKN